MTIATLDVDLGGGVPIALLSGEVDASNAPGFTTRLKASVPNTALGLVLDLSPTTYIDSAGVHMLFDLADALRRRQQRLQLVVPPETFVADVVAAVGFGGNVGVSADLTGALAVVEQGPD